MITHKNGDIFTTEFPALGHGVNCQGVMGSGIAVAVKKNHPDVYTKYKAYCKSPGMHGGDLLVVQAESNGRFIFNMASQEKTGRNAKYSWLRQSVLASLQHCAEHKISGLALPRIGSGIGGLEWEKVVPIIEEESEAFPQVDLELWTYEDLPDKYWTLF